MISENLKNQLEDWEILYPFFESEEWPKLKEALKPDLSTITPDISVWFRAFKQCKYKNLKVIWLGGSPYNTKDPYTKNNTAIGLAFSTENIHTVPTDLFKIYKGIESDLYTGINLNMERRNNLEFLAKQGVLLLNSALTTNYNKSDSHLKIWEPFIQFVIKAINDNKKDIIFCGFGEHPNKLLLEVDKDIHTVYERDNPGKNIYTSGTWPHENLFSKINNKKTILWDNYLVELEVPF